MQTKHGYMYRPSMLSYVEACGIVYYNVLLYLPASFDSAQDAAMPLFTREASSFYHFIERISSSYGVSDSNVTSSHTIEKSPVNNTT